MQTIEDPCPYIEGKRSTAELCGSADRFSHFDDYLAQGWRRSGSILYRYRCRSCTLCTPLRIPAGLADSARRKRLYAKNRDLEFRLAAPKYNEEHLRLYEKYLRFWHGDDSADLEFSYMALLDSPLALLTEYRDSRNRLTALGFADAGKNSLSSTYFVFDPDESSRSLGTFSVFREAELAAQLGRSFYYLGYWVPGVRKMEYKADFPPFELLMPRSGIPPEPSSECRAWTRFDSSVEARQAFITATHR